LPSAPFLYCSRLVVHIFLVSTSASQQFSLPLSCHLKMRANSEAGWRNWNIYAQVIPYSRVNLAPMSTAINSVRQLYFRYKWEKFIFKPVLEKGIYWLIKWIQVVSS
jgi:hypothetical protein